MKIHNDYFSLCIFQKVFDVFEDLRELRDSNDIVIDPKSADVLALIVIFTGVTRSWIIAHSQIQVSNSMYKLSPNVTVLCEKVALVGLTSCQNIMLVTARVVSSRNHQ